MCLYHKPRKTTIRGTEEGVLTASCRVCNEDIVRIMSEDEHGQPRQGPWVARKLVKQQLTLVSA